MISQANSWAPKQPQGEREGLGEHWKEPAAVAGSLPREGGGPSQMTVEPGKGESNDGPTRRQRPESQLALALDAVGIL